MNGSKITPSILGLRSSGSCVSSRVISGVILQVVAYISQVIGNHGTLVCRVNMHNAFLLFT